MITALLGLAGVIAAGTLGYITARLKNSGKINTTEASTLWAQSTLMRQELTARANDLELELARQKAAHDKAMARMFARLDEAYEEIKLLRLRLNGRA